MFKKNQKFKFFIKKFQLVRWVILFFLVVFFVGSFYLIVQAQMADVDKLSQQLAKPTTIYDKSGKKAGELADQKGTQVSLKEISPNLRKAVLSTEDRNFYHEFGFSFSGYARALWLFVRNKITGRNYISGGGSTITQQLAKNAYLGQEQTFTRKFKELYLSIEIEKNYSKNKILSMYLNSSYFGHNIYGVEDAAEGYFGVSAANLSVSQAASIAGMLANPTLYDPTKYLKYATSRRNTVLQNMVSNDKLSQKKATAIEKTKVVAKTPNVSQKTNYQYPWFFDAVIDEAISKYHLTETEIMNRGYKIYTTLDQEDQKDLQEDYSNKYLFPVEDDQSASIALNARTGGVLAVIGGRGKHVFRGFNRAIQARRSPGSLIKPLVVYAPALSRGYSSTSTFPNTPITFSGNYRPTNALGYESGKVDMATAIADSYNIPAVYLLDKIGVKTGYDYAKKFGLPVEKSDENLALALGGMKEGVSPQEMAQAYTAFANNGKMSTAHYITKIVDATGSVIVNRPDVTQKQVISKKVANEMTTMMFGVYKDGTGAAAAPSGYKVAGKTGTTQDVDNTSIQYASRDLWAIAYTPDLVVASWQGYDVSTTGKTLPTYLSESLGPLFKVQTEQLISNSPQTAFGSQSSTKESSSSWLDKLKNLFNNSGKTGKNISNQFAGIKDKISDAWNSLSNFIQEHLKQ
ncbi:transglycosylase domain-containing protein [Oenococcus oeni]|uniref:transglycosylase domain-containing protein n=1 Tax=Oenococcus oeni TaxID=1247 RepID=UPI00050FE2E1|nr:PBP1A family penicillin-binding protein [Oenococcus oeni]KGH84845.1 penicillin-binding protein [Oenococcus oeni IOEB_C28]